jgi:hypothetical protein
MELKSLIYKNDHFYDWESKKRVRLAKEANIIITALPEYFVPFAPVGTYPPKILNTEEKREKTLAELTLSKQKKYSIKARCLSRDD